MNENGSRPFAVFIAVAIALTLVVGVIVAVLVQNTSTDTPDTGSAASGAAEVSVAPTASQTRLPQEEGYESLELGVPDTVKALVRDVTGKLAPWKHGESPKDRQERVKPQVAAEKIGESPWAHDLAGIEGAYVTVELGTISPGDPSKSTNGRLEVSQEVIGTIHLPKGGSETTSTVYTMWHYTVDVSDPAKPQIIDVREPVRP